VSCLNPHIESYSPHGAEESLKKQIYRDEQDKRDENKMILTIKMLVLSVIPFILIIPVK
jgi:hypothetical protein